MIALFKGKAVGQVDTFLCEGKVYSVKDLQEIIRKYKVKPQKKKGSTK